MPNWMFLFRQTRRRLWVTVALYSALGLAASLVSSELGRYVPSDFPLKLGSDSVDDILSILASSMLAVTTFAMTTLVSAYTSVSSSFTPRAARLLVGDSGVRNSLSTFVGAFIYSIVGIVAVHTGYYGAEGRVILFFVTLAVLMLVVIAMLRWIGQLSILAQSHNVIERILRAVESALAAQTTVISAEAWGSDSGVGWPIYAATAGYVQNVDVQRLERIAAAHRLQFYLSSPPGAFVHCGEPLLKVGGPMLSDDQIRSALSAVSIGPERTFDQDPLFGLQVLGEISARALSPGVNDAGTAREVVGRATARLAAQVPKRSPSDASSRVVMKPISCAELLQSCFMPVIQHGAGEVQLQIALQAALHALAASPVEGMQAAARELSQEALLAAIEQTPSQRDRAKLARAAQWAAQELH